MRVFLSILIGLFLMIAVVIAGLAAVGIVLVVLSGAVDVLARLFATRNRKHTGPTFTG